MAASCINWLASYPKSGNTWVRAFLEYYETGKLDINCMCTVKGDEQLYYYQAMTPKPVHEFDIYEWALIRPAALSMYLYMHPERDHLVLKTHNAHAIIGDMPLFPAFLSGPSVYLIRNPLDIVPSFARHAGKTLTEMIKYMQSDRHAFAAKEGKRSMIGLLSSWNKHVTAWTSVPDILVVRYEDLQINPEYWFTEILKQFGYEINKSKVLETIDAVKLNKLKEYELRDGFKEAGKGDIFFGGKKPRLTSKQIDRIIEGYEPVMRKFDYLAEELKYGSNY
jgi:hypothetical protein